MKDGNEMTVKQNKVMLCRCSAPELGLCLEMWKMTALEARQAI
jgi:hypothetical protein